MGVGAKSQGNAGECRGMSGECIVGCAKSWGMQRNAGQCQGMQGNARGTYGSGSKVSWDCRGMPRKQKGVGAKSQGNVK